jgi:hypothetical protein
MAESEVSCKKLPAKAEYLDSVEEIFLEKKARGAQEPATSY